MPCYHPLPAWYSNEETVNGKTAISFRPVSGVRERERLELPCGRCIGCRLERAREWAMRCVHESKLYDDNCFITLTYSDDKLPMIPGPFSDRDYPSLRPRDFVLFMKRLRKSLEPKTIRFFHCGEYGDQTLRPHHHALIFNHDFRDRVFVKNSKSGSRLYSSRILDDLWGNGNCWVGDVSFASAGYIARYTLKKVHGDNLQSHEHYYGRVPEYGTMSRRPGIGHAWAMRYMDAWYRDDVVIVNGAKSKPPRYYDNLCEKERPALLARAKRVRREQAASSPDNSGARLLVREVVKAAAIEQLTRSSED
ncbi:MAG: replication initiator protein [Arizlama microvirus]|nr:MAG: replication initiator protein [Arizlama microvirus]